MLVKEEISVPGDKYAQTALKEKLAIVQCETHPGTLSTTKLKAILKKCVKTGNVKLSLVFVKLEGVRGELRKFIKFCRVEQINVYRVIPGVVQATKLSLLSQLYRFLRSRF